jgi:hypothetical protein
MGLFNNASDTCTQTAFSFQEQFWSGIMNSGAFLTGLTTDVAPAIYSEVKLCGVQSFKEKYIPTDSPTPLTQAPTQSGASVPAEESFNFFGSFLEDACPPTPVVGPLMCPDFFLNSNTPVPVVVKKELKSIAPVDPTQHIVGWWDCEGNVQFGSPSELAVFNGRVPFQNVMKQLENLVKTLEPCRVGAVPSAAAWARYFFPWTVNFWGGVFYSDQAAQNIFLNVNPAAKLDESLRYYPQAEVTDINDNFITNPPFADVANAPASCNLASTSAGACELAADIHTWFEGNTFPAGWNGPTSLKVKFASGCASSAFPSAFLTCDGACDAGAKSGCCFLRNAFIALNPAGTCPQGYKLQEIDSGITDFLFANGTVPRSNDTSLLNFISLLTSRQISFGPAGAPFVKVKGTLAERSFCLIDGEALGNNTDKWAQTAATEDCPVPASPPNGTKGCPQFLSGGLRGCAGASCTVVPLAVPCGDQCPFPGLNSRAPTAAPTTPGTTMNPASLLAPVFALVGFLMLL